MKRVLSLLAAIGVAVCLTVSASARSLHTQVNVTVSGNGSVSGTINCSSSCSMLIKAGTEVNLSANPSSGATFDGWGGECGGTDGCSFTVPPDGGPALNVSASFTGGTGGGGGGGGPPPPPPPPSRYSLNVAKSGSGAGSVVSDPAGIDCGSTCSMTSDNGQLIKLTATAAPGSVFKGWSGACAGATCSVTLVADSTVTAVFDTAAAPVEFPLTVSKAGDGGGTVTSSTGGIACGTTCSTTLPGGTAIGLTATPADGSTFTGWSGACTGAGACSFSVAAATAVTATFETVKDTAVPRVVAFAATGKRGKKAKLSYFVSDDSGQSSESLLIYNGRKILGRAAAAMHAATAGTVRNVMWKVPATATLGKRKFCVTAADAAGNRSAPSCARLTIKR